MAGLVDSGFILPTVLPQSYRKRRFYSGSKIYLHRLICFLFCFSVSFLSQEYCRRQHFEVLKACQYCKLQHMQLLTGYEYCKLQHLELLEACQYCKLQQLRFLKGYYEHCKLQHLELLQHCQYCKLQHLRFLKGEYGKLNPLVFSKFQAFVGLGRLGYRDLVVKVI